MKLAALAFLAGLSACTQTVKNDPISPGGSPLAAANSQFSVWLVNGSGTRLPTFSHEGATFVEGISGTAYGVRVNNDSDERVEIVVTVDGRDVVSGAPGNFVEQRGYLVDAHDYVVIDGFRQSMSDVATFRFTSPGDSYSARMGTPENVGVIGVAIFRGKERTPTPIAVDGRGQGREDEAKSAAAPAPAATGDIALGEGAPATPGRAAQERSNLGTQYGEARYAPVVEQAFERADADDPDVLLAMYYDDHAGLVRRGVLQDSPVRPDGPQPFPGNDQRFAAPPP